MRHFTSAVMLAASVAGLLTLAGCGSLPASGPSSGDIAGGAGSQVRNDGDKIGFDYALVDLSDKIVNLISADQSSLSKTFGLGRAAAPDVRVGVGDVLALTVFESAAGGLFIPLEAGSRSGNFVTMPNQTIDRSGMLSVPYAGGVPAVGKTLRDIQTDIEKRLASRAIEPQAILTLVSQQSNEVSVVGYVNSPGKFQLRPGGERVLDLLARAGGLKKEPYQSSVTIQRNGRRATVDFNTLIEQPKENIYVGIGDTLYVYGETKSYVAFGATGQNLKIDFGAERLSLAEAVGNAGGLLDSRAEPGQVFVYRVENTESLRKMGVDVTRYAGKDEVPTIYRTNFRDPASYFAARSFEMRDKDVIYVSNAASVELVKFLNVLDAVSASVGNTPSDAVTARDAFHQLGRAAHN